MGDIRKNISRHEMACRCGCGFNACDTDLMDILQETTDHFAEKYADKGLVYLSISGPNRCLYHNETVQKKAAARRRVVYKPFSSKSTHMLGIAADFTLIIKHSDKSNTIVQPQEVYEYLDNRFPNSCGIGLYHNRCHFDVRPKRARWGL